ncbi:MAG: DUF6516 family protein [Deltaproteobacteria bacterium]|nr:DUF6516 family protein [Deltaproteobacteria bacterium]
MSSIHEDLVELLNNELASLLDGEPQFLYDGIQVKLKSGPDLQIIYPSAEEYVFSWEQDSITLRIDTAPLHKKLSTFPNHFHSGDEVKDDNITSIQNSPGENLEKVLRFIGG